VPAVVMAGDLSIVGFDDIRFAPVDLDCAWLNFSAREGWRTSLDLPRRLG
jgi:hypothetical protein